MLALPECVLSCPLTMELIVRAKLTAEFPNSYDDAWDALNAERPDCYHPTPEVEQWMRENWDGPVFGAAPVGGLTEPDPMKIGVTEGEIASFCPPSRAYARSWMARFLEVYVSSGGNTTMAAAAVNIARRTPGMAAEYDAQFRAAWQSAREHLADIYRTVLHDRAVNGWQEPVYGATGDYRDGLIGTITKYDNSLLKFRATVLCEEHRQHDKDRAGNINVTASANAAASASVKVTPERLKNIQERNRLQLEKQMRRETAPAAGNN